MTCGGDENLRCWYVVLGCKNLIFHVIAVRIVLVNIGVFVVVVVVVVVVVAVVVVATVMLLLLSVLVISVLLFWRILVMQTNRSREKDR